ncbi:MAG: hypothetical protein GX295_11710 [Syntrophomonadaceae bacterium]|nr:hypothetical protein [Syntrophomonadaceae bacterium]
MRKKEKGFSVPELIILMAVVVTVALTAHSSMGAKVKQKAGAVGTDIGNINIHVSSGATSASVSTGLTGMPTSINIH